MDRLTKHCMALDSRRKSLNGKRSKQAVTQLEADQAQTINV